MKQRMRSTVRSVFLVCFLTVFLSAPEASGADGRVVIFALNDMHSQLLPVTTKVKTTTVLFGGLAHAGGVIAEQRAAEKDPVLALQAGDMVAGLMWRLFSGEPEFSALEHAGVQAGTLGNHEFDYGVEHLKKLLSFTSMPMVVSNLEFDDDFLKQRVLKRLMLQAGAMKVGVFGLASPNLFALAGAGDSVKVDAALRQISEKMVAGLREEGADAILLLSRLSDEENEALAAGVEGIHAILGGSSHNELHETRIVEGPNGWKTALGRAGAYCAFVGRLRLAVKDGKLDEQETEWSLLRVTPRARTDGDVLALALEYERKLNEAMLFTIGTFSDAADARAQTVRARESALGNLIADSLRWRMKTDVAVINGGGVRGDKIFPAGSVSRKVLAEILPFDNEIHIVLLTGEQLRKAFEIAASSLVGKDDRYESSVRTYAGGFLQISGARVVYSLSGRPTLVDPDGKALEWGNRVKSLHVERDGAWLPVEDDASYTLAANSWTATGGDRFSVLGNAPQQKTDFKDLDVLADYIASHPEGRVRLELDGRIAVEE